MLQWCYFVLLKHLGEIETIFHVFLYFEDFQKAFIILYSGLLGMLSPMTNWEYKL